MEGDRRLKQEVARFKAQFSRKLLVAFATLLLITLALAWYFYDTVAWYEHDVQRIALANDVLHSYQELSRQTFQELNALGDRVASTGDNGLAGWDKRANTLRKAIFRVRHGIATELAFEQSASDGGELESLAEIERVVERIIRTSERINQALASGNPELAMDELTELRNTGVAAYFNRLIITAIDAQERKARTADQDAIALARYIKSVLPVFIFVLVAVTLLTTWLFSRSLTRSVSALHDGARAFTSGNLAHRIPELREDEFQRLGEAFNTMALELSENRTRLHDANVKLEATVEERTRALKTSNKKLAEVDVTRRKLLADISHEFRTPLTVMRGEAEIALRGAKNTKADYRESLQRIMDQADHTTRLVDDLLFIARADAGEPRLKMRSVAIPGMVVSVCNDFAAKAEQKGIRIELECEENRAVVLGDSGRLRQVFAILLDNALRYSNPGGTVEVRLSRTDSEVSISFRDYGIGLSDEEAEMAFERFYRGHKAVEHAGGTGLGLPVAKAIVEAHKGHISLSGELGGGAAATVTLPVESQLRVVA